MKINCNLDQVANAAKIRSFENLISKMPIGRILWHMEFGIPVVVPTKYPNTEWHFFIKKIENGAIDVEAEKITLGGAAKIKRI